jgi:integrase
LLEASRGSRYEALYALALSTGARRGELLGLKWSDMDLDAARLSITRSLQRCQRRLNVDPLWREVTKVKLTHPVTV